MRRGGARVVLQRAQPGVYRRPRGAAEVCAAGKTGSAVTVQVVAGRRQHAGRGIATCVGAARVVEQGVAQRGAATALSVYAGRTRLRRVEGDGRAVDGDGAVRVQAAAGVAGSVCTQRDVAQRQRRAAARVVDAAAVPARRVAADGDPVQRHRAAVVGEAGAPVCGDVVADRGVDGAERAEVVDAGAAAGPVGADDDVRQRHVGPSLGIQAATIGVGRQQRTTEGDAADGQAGARAHMEHAVERLAVDRRNSRSRASNGEAAVDVEVAIEVVVAADVGRDADAVAAGAEHDRAGAGRLIGGTDRLAQRDQAVGAGVGQQRFDRGHVAVQHVGGGADHQRPAQIGDADADQLGGGVQAVAGAHGDVVVVVGAGVGGGFEVGRVDEGQHAAAAIDGEGGRVGAAGDAVAQRRCRAVGVAGRDAGDGAGVLRYLHEGGGSAAVAGDHRGLFVHRRHGHADGLAVGELAVADLHRQFVDVVGVGVLR